MLYSFWQPLQSLSQVSIANIAVRILSEINKNQSENYLSTKNFGGIYVYSYNSIGLISLDICKIGQALPNFLNLSTSFKLPKRLVTISPKKKNKLLRQNFFQTLKLVRGAYSFWLEKRKRQFQCPQSKVTKKQVFN